MNKLMMLITAKMGEGKSYRDIERETGISHVSLIKYHKGSTPDGKNLAILAKYFKTDYYELLDSVGRRASPHTFGPSIEDKMALSIWSDYSPAQKWKAIQLLHGLATNDCKPDQT